MNEIINIGNAFKNTKTDDLPALIQEHINNAYISIRMFDYYSAVFNQCLDMNSQPYSAINGLLDNIDATQAKIEGITSQLNSVDQKKVSETRRLHQLVSERNSSWFKFKAFWRPSLDKEISLQIKDLCRTQQENEKYLAEFNSSLQGLFRERQALDDEISRMYAVQKDLFERKQTLYKNKKTTQRNLYQLLLLLREKSIDEKTEKICKKLIRDKTRSILNYSLKWLPEPREDIMLFEITPYSQNTREISDCLRFIDTQGIKWEAQLTSKNIILYKEGNVFSPKIVDRIDYDCLLEKWIAEFNPDGFYHKQIVSLKNNQITTAPDGHLSKQIVYKDWDGNDLTATFGRYGKLSWFVHQNDDSGIAHTSNLIFFKNANKEFCKLILIDNEVYLRNDARDAQQAGNWDGRLKMYSFDYLNHLEEKWRVIFVGNVGYHFPYKNFEASKAAELMKVNSNFHYITGYDWKFESTILPNFGAVTLAHELNADYKTVDPKTLEDFQLMAMRKNSKGDITGAHTYEYGDIFLNDFMKLDTKDVQNNKEPYLFYSGTIQCLNWDKEPDEIAIHSGALYRVDNNTGCHKFVESFNYLSSGGGKYRCAYRNGRFYHSAKDSDAYHTDSILIHIDWNMYELKTWIARV